MMRKSLALPPYLWNQISIVRDRMISTRKFAEANWLGVAAADPSLCMSSIARSTLLRASDVANQLGFPDVSVWIEFQVLKPI
jgi:hypothetical protein